MGTAKELLAHVPQVGRVEWIGRAPASGAPMESVASVQIEVGTGLEGEHHARSGRGKRQVTLVQKEHLEVVSALLGRPVRPEDVRRNVVVSGLNVHSLKGRRFRLGAALLEFSEPCEPCGLMERNLGAGGFQAMRGHSGVCAVVLEAGCIAVGDSVRVEHEPAAEAPSGSRA